MENKTAKGAGMLKVVGILMIVFGGIALVLGIIAAVAVAAVAFLSEGLLTTNLLYASTALMVASAVAELVAGIVAICWGMDSFSLSKIVAAMLIFSGVYMVTVSEKSRS